jgi:hypothetical protein
LKSFEKPQRGDINIAWGSAPGNPSYDHVEYKPKRSNALGNPSYGLSLVQESENLHTTHKYNGFGEITLCQKNRFFQKTGFINNTGIYAFLH